MSALDNSAAPPLQSKKRKRTGKEREERKKAAIQAKQEAEAAAEANGESEEGIIVRESVQETAAPHEAASIEHQAGQSSVDVEKVAKRIPQALKSLHPVFKQAKTFETRRLIKKIKFLRSKGVTDETADLESQLKIIHEIQLHHLAQSHLLVKLRKHPLFRQAPLPSEVASLLSPPSASSASSASTSATPALINKAENRLCSAKIVAERVKNVLSWTVCEEGAKLVTDKKAATASAGKDGSKKAAESSDEEDDEEEEEGEEVNFCGDIARPMVNESDSEEDSDDERVIQDRAADAAGWESGSVSGSDIEGEDVGIASESESESDDSDAIDIPSIKRAKTTVPPLASKSKPVKPEKADKPPKSAKDLTSSIFLPSLSVGFTRGDDGDSDPDLDDDPNGVAGKQPLVRKNRRGQRARQAIWEKKYGKNAKHVVKAQEEEKRQVQKAREKAEVKGRTRDSGWGARSGKAVGPAVNAASAPTAAAASHTQKLYPESKQSQTEQKKSLHPSWEAAKLRKQKMGAVQTEVKAQKIVFD
ncbi:hypothetical protein I314_06091 [Cryptococcus bacillisporus CA1873]|uniref:Bud22 domain-containing protein n=1 Tax=Cryptococcus bacillisporus CA1873 TaxID=1296111 RepID=A0ABR5B3H8_CRYGA|nr:hypothetical protein I314_06091 [Cryptococcus bacillisporus CA1873]|eukprot:KIR58126.1 hypothetical protein I314_06091 [Cryptococcus gattii CA1873]